MGINGGNLYGILIVMKLSVFILDKILYIKASNNYCIYIYIFGYIIIINNIKFYIYRTFTELSTFFKRCILSAR